MAPKRTVGKAQVKTSQLKSKKGVKKKLTNAVRKAKIPPISDLCIVPDKSENELPKSKTKLTLPLTNEVKIMHANEVVRSVFNKKPTSVNINLTVTVPNKRMVTRSGHLKNNSEIQENVEKNTNSEPTQSLEHNEPIQDVTKKKAVNSKLQNRKRSAAVNIPFDDIEKQLSIITNEIVPGTPIKRRKLSLKRKVMTVPVKEGTENVPTNKGKEETQETAPITDISVVVNTNEIAVDTKKSKTLSQGENIISCRKNSSASASTCLSWTKDISSSSTGTCVTVQSNDFVRIDKKLPIIKLTDIESKVKRKDTNDNIFEESSLDNYRSKSIRQSISECSAFSTGDLNVSQTLNLSTSSMTSVRSNRETEHSVINYKAKDNIVEKLRKSLDNLSSKMKNFDLEIINWIGYENESRDATTKSYHARIIDILKEESEVIKYCKEIKRVLRVDQEEPTQVTEKEPSSIYEETQSQLESNNPNEMQDKVENFEQKQNGKETIKDANKSPNHKETSEKHKSFDDDLDDDNNEDDDAISLFADTMADEDEDDDYCAPPARRDKFFANERVCQSKTNVEDSVKKYEQAYSRVEKQTADSSSTHNRNSDDNIINRFENNDTELVNDADHFNNGFKFPNSVGRRPTNGLLNNRFYDFRNNDTPINVPGHFHKKFTDFENIQIRAPVNNTGQRFSEVQNNTNRNFSNLPGSLGNNDSTCRPSFNVSGNGNVRSSDNVSNTTMVGADVSSLTFDQFKQSTPNPVPTSSKQVTSGSGIFHNICIFNLVSRCKNIVCAFPHVNIEIDVVKSGMQNLSEELFLRECMFMMNWPILRRKYGMYYIEECVRRDLTIWAVRVTYALIKGICMHKETKRSHSRMIEIVEITLLHLNNANFESCTDILRSKIGPKGLLCDYFMNVISETQNFSRFKNLFIKLSLFMYQIGRLFRLEVASRVLERLCILPYDDALAKVFIHIIERTNSNIFSAPMMGFFEKQLSANNTELYERLMSLKEQWEGTNLTFNSPYKILPLMSLNVPNQTSTPVARADSPDTTNVDSMNKPAEPFITRTITINRSIDTSNINVSPASESSEDTMQKGCEPKKYQVERSWRKCQPGLGGLRPPRHVYKQHWFSSRTYNNLPKFRGPPPHDPY